MHSWHILGTLTDHDRQSLLDHLRYALSGIMLGMACGLLVLACSRAVFVNTFAGEALQRIDRATLTEFLLNAALLDLKYTAHAYLPAAGLALVFGVCRSWAGFYRRLFVLLNVLAILSLIVPGIINFYHFQTLDRSLDAHTLELLRHNPWESITAALTAYPGCWHALWIIALLWAYQHCFPAWHLRLQHGMLLPNSPLAVSMVLLILLGFYGLLLRGSLGPQPLGERDAQVSIEPRVNAAAANGPAILYWAWRDARRNVIFEKVSDSALGILFARLGLGISTPDDVYAPLRHITPADTLLENDPPDIVLSFMAGMSTHLLHYDDPQRRDLLGELRAHLHTDIYFRHAISGGNNAPDSLNRALLGVPDDQLSGSGYAQYSFVTNLLLPFKDKGFHIVFISAAAGSWHNLRSFMLAQGVDEFIDSHDLTRDYPAARTTNEGTDDEIMWEAVYDYLKQGHVQPLLIITLSHTNRPPYTLPEQSSEPDLSLTRSESRRFAFSNMPAILAAFRYGNDQLGKFITRLKLDPDLARGTFLAATGDHNLRSIGYSDHPEELALGYGVPIYMYIPEHYRKPDLLHYNPSAYVSHKDLLPTLIRYTLSEATYYSLGCNMLGSEHCSYDFAVNDNIAIPRSRSLVCGLTAGAQGAFAYPLLPDSLLATPLTHKLTDPQCELALQFREFERKLYHYQLAHQPAADNDPHASHDWP